MEIHETKVYQGINGKKELLPKVVFLWMDVCL
jgi:hypothetical protein